MSGCNHLHFSWAEVEIGDVAEVKGGKRLPKGKSLLEIPTAHPYIRVTDFDYGSVDISNLKYLDEVTHDAIKNYTISKDDLYISIAGTIGLVGEIPVELDGANLTENAAKLCGLSGIEKNYLRYVLSSNSSKEQFDDSTTSSGQPKLALFRIKSCRFPLPPLAEQKVIADKLDTMLAQVETTKARLDRIPLILKTFRQSVLAAAVSGKLTEEWRKKNHFNVTQDERLEEIRKYKYQTWIEAQEAKYDAKGKWPKTDAWKKKYKEAEVDPEFQARELPEGWVYQPLDGLVYISARIGWKGLKASEYTEAGPLFLSVHSLNYGREVKLSKAFHISQERYDESPEIKLENDDILLCKDGAGIGKIGTVKNLQEPATINSSLLLIRSGKFFIPEFLYFFLAGPTMQRLVQERMTGSAVPHLFQRDVKEFVLEVPPLSEQTEIVRRVEELFAFADRIEQKANAALERVNNLTQSILAKAFRGELTADWRAQNPDLISGDNSAEALLEKIKAEREALSSKKKPKKKAVKKAK
jgi:type I restriction enzyme S subunit